MKLKGGYKDRAIITQDIVPNDSVTLFPAIAKKATKSFGFMFIFRYVSIYLDVSSFLTLDNDYPDVLNIG